MLNPIASGATTHAQIANTDEAVQRFAVTQLHPDAEVHPGDLVWWLAREEQLEIHADLAASGLL